MLQRTVGPGPMPGYVKSDYNALMLVTAAFLLDVQHWEGECEASIGCGGQVAAWPNH